MAIGTTALAATALGVNPLMGLAQRFTGGGQQAAAGDGTSSAQNTPMGMATNFVVNHRPNAELAAAHKVTASHGGKRFTNEAEIIKREIDHLRGWSPWSLIKRFLRWLTPGYSTAQSAQHWVSEDKKLTKYKNARDIAKSRAEFYLDEINERIHAQGIYSKLRQGDAALEKDTEIRAYLDGASAWIGDLNNEVDHRFLEDLWDKIHNPRPVGFFKLRGFFGFAERRLPKFVTDALESPVWARLQQLGYGKSGVMLIKPSER